MPSASSMTTFAVVLLAAAPSAMAGKRGIAWPWYNEGSNLDETNLANGNGNVNWMYNWETWRSANNKNVNWIGTQATMESSSSPISQLKTRAAQQGWNTVFSLNKPDLNGISPSTAANWYIHQNSGQGLDWTAKFISACAGRCYFDYVNIHWYGSTFAQFKSHVQDAHNRFPNYKLVVSEFALNKPATRDQQVAFLKQAMSFLDGTSYVAMYSVFVASSPGKMQGNTGGDQVGITSSLYNDDGSLSANGIAYRG
ncbi:glycoside hydrolase family 128 protein [Ceratobasidium sp. AG-Ba]|nr:glycoside hydrolase family 128 protein [Ceratobasidium sp. AG-Ba]QRW09276.1 glycoside hydrolase family 128 protein [Ceratobasidium sp. AG-Ba]